MLNTSSRPLRILRLVLLVGETIGAYNESSLPLADKHDITICAFFKSEVMLPEKITYLEGDGSLRGYIRVLRAALTEREYDIIHVHSPHVGLLFLLANVFTRKKSTPPAVCTVQNSYPNYKPRNRLMLLPIFASFQRLVFCSHASLDSFPGLFRWLAGDRVRVVQNAVDIDRVDRVIDSHAKYFSKNGLVVASVGRLVEIKNHFSVLQAFSKIDDHVSGLMFIGEGHLHNQLLSESQALGLEERVNLTGLIPRSEVYQNLTRADLFISASRGEGLPVAVLEAMACRCPVLLSDIAPHREIADGIDFIPLIDPDDVLGFACEIDRFRRMSSSQRAEVGEKCRKLVEDRFNLTNNHARYNEIYGQLLRREVGATQSSLVESDDGANSWRPGCG